jgi:hypothetical protein
VIPTLYLKVGNGLEPRLEGISPELRGRRGSLRRGSLSSTRRRGSITTTHGLGDDNNSIGGGTRRNSLPHLPGIGIFQHVLQKT